MPQQMYMPQANYAQYGYPYNAYAGSPAMQLPGASPIAASPGVAVGECDFFIASLAKLTSRLCCGRSTHSTPFLITTGTPVQQQYADPAQAAAAYYQQAQQWQAYYGGQAGELNTPVQIRFNLCLDEPQCSRTRVLLRSSSPAADRNSAGSTLRMLGYGFRVV